MNEEGKPFEKARVCNRLGSILNEIAGYEAIIERLKNEKRELIEIMAATWTQKMDETGKKSLVISCGDDINYLVKRADFKKFEYPLEYQEELANIETRSKAARAPFEGEKKIVLARAEMDPRTKKYLEPRWTVTL